MKDAPGLRGEPRALPDDQRGGLRASGAGLRRQGHRRVHEARLQPPDGSAGARRSGRPRRGVRDPRQPLPRVRRAALRAVPGDQEARRGRLARAQDRPRLLRLRRSSACRARARRRPLRGRPARRTPERTRDGSDRRQARSWCAGSRRRGSRGSRSRRSCRRSGSRSSRMRTRSAPRSPGRRARSTARWSRTKRGYERLARRRRCRSRRSSCRRARPTTART